jgi:hypothetical protein
MVRAWLSIHEYARKGNTIKEAELQAIEQRWRASTAPQQIVDPKSGETLWAPADVLALIAEVRRQRAAMQRAVALAAGASRRAASA